MTLCASFLAALCLMTLLAYGQRAGIEWDALNTEVMDLYRAGKYDRAVVVAKKALQVAEQNVGPNHPDVATSLNGLAALYRMQGDYAKAEPLLKRALAIKENALGPNHFKDPFEEKVNNFHEVTGINNTHQPVNNPKPDLANDKEYWSKAGFSLTPKEAADRVVSSIVNNQPISIDPRPPEWYKSKGFAKTPTEEANEIVKSIVDADNAKQAAAAASKNKPSIILTVFLPVVIDIVIIWAIALGIKKIANKYPPAAPEQSTVSGVGGWLLLLVTWFMLSPLSGIILMFGVFTSIEELYPILKSATKWSTYKTMCWWIALFTSCLQFYAGLGLIKERSISAVKRAKIILWINGPLVTLITIFLIVLIFGKFELNLIYSIIVSVIWITYLSKSKRVKATYGITTPST